MCRSRPEFFNHFLSLWQDLWLKLELIDWKSSISASLYWVTSVCHKAQLSRVAGGLFSGPHTCTALTHWAVSLTKIISFLLLSHNNWKEKLKKRKAVWAHSFRGFSPWSLELIACGSMGRQPSDRNTWLRRQLTTWWPISRERKKGAQDPEWPRPPPEPHILRIPLPTYSAKTGPEPVRREPLGDVI